MESKDSIHLKTNKPSNQQESFCYNHLQMFCEVSFVFRNVGEFDFF